MVTLTLTLGSILEVASVPIRGRRRVRARGAAVCRRPAHAQQPADSPVLCVLRRLRARCAQQLHSNPKTAVHARVRPPPPNRMIRWGSKARERVGRGGVRGGVGRDSMGGNCCVFFFSAIRFRSAKMRRARARARRRHRSRARRAVPRRGAGEEASSGTGDCRRSGARRLRRRLRAGRAPASRWRWCVCWGVAHGVSAPREARAPAPRVLLFRPWRPRFDGGGKREGDVGLRVAADASAASRAAPRHLAWGSSGPHLRRVSTLEPPPAAARASCVATCRRARAHRQNARAATVRRRGPRASRATRGEAPGSGAVAARRCLRRQRPAPVPPLVARRRRAPRRRPAAVRLAAAGGSRG